MKKKGMRNPNQEFLMQQLNDKPLIVGQGNFEVVAIKAQRLTKRGTEYLVAWKGHTDMTWVKASEIDADELIEDWELENDVY
jgi:hypothetical protein